MVRSSSGGYAGNAFWRWSVLLLLASLGLCSPGVGGNDVVTGKPCPQYRVLKRGGSADYAVAADLPALQLSMVKETVKTPGGKKTVDARGPNTTIETDAGPVTAEIFGRSPAEAKFKAEDKLIESAGEEDWVPVEIGYSPLFRPDGHTTLRIGNSLFEKGWKGWSAHEGGRDSARAYIFNNPFFKTQIERFGELIPAFNIGVTVFAKKKDVVKLREELRHLSTEEGNKEDPFSILFANCNSSLMCRLNNIGVTGVVSPTGPRGASSTLTFQRLLALQATEGTPPGTVSIYPLPKTEKTPEQWANAVPDYVRHQSGVLVEAWRLVTEGLRNRRIPVPARAPSPFEADASKAAQPVEAKSKSAIGEQPADGTGGQSPPQVPGP